MSVYKKTDRGIALFIAVLLSMGLSAISLSAMMRMSTISQTTGSALKDKKLLMYAESALNIVSAEVQYRAIGEEAIGNNTVYYINGTEGIHSFRYYPRHVSVVPTDYYERTLFAYRAVARRFAGSGDFPPGFQVPIAGLGGHCFDITVDVREVIYIGDANTNVNAQSNMIAGSGTRYYLGSAKTVGVISCFDLGG